MNIDCSCNCQHCNQPIGFNHVHAGEVLACPSCGLETIVFVPQRPGPAQAKTKTTGSRKLLKIAAWTYAISVALCTWLFMQETQSEAGSPFLQAFGGALISGLAIVAGIALYFFPTITAWQNKKRNFDAIAVLNLIAGWTFIGWVVAIVWANTAEPEKA